MPKTPDLTKTPTRFRGSVSRGFAGDDLARESARVEREGGDKGAGLIRQFSAIERGEALGHGVWIDERFVSDVSDALNAAGGQGLKSRFTHPDASSDAMGKHLGRAKTGTLDGDRVLTDLHFSRAAHKSPEGNLADYTMTFAEDDPEAFGASIVFFQDFDATRAHWIQFGGHVVLDEYGGEYLAGDFQSPDPDNLDNLPHVHLETLEAVDIVGDPAANRGGLFSSVAGEADQLLTYALGLSDAVPTVSAFDVDPTRIASFAAKFLKRKGLRVVPTDSDPEKEQPMSEDTNNTPDTPTDFLAELDRYREAFGRDNGEKWYRDGVDFSAAAELHCRELTTQLAALTDQHADALEAVKAEHDSTLAAKSEEIAALQATIDAAELGEHDGTDFSSDEDGAPPKKSKKELGTFPNYCKIKD